MPLRCSTSVVLPAPFGPSSATRSPRWMVKSTPNRACLLVGIGEDETLDVDRSTAHKPTTLAVTAMTTAAREIASPSTHWTPAAPDSDSNGIRPV